MLDVALAYRRYQFLGEEFLTWLWYLIEKEPGRLPRIDKQLAALEIGRRMVIIKRGSGENDETVTIKGANAEMDEGLLALKKGGMVAELHLIYRSGDNEWQFNLKGESLNISSLKVPETGKIESDDEIEGAVIEKIYLLGQIVNLVNALFRSFVKLRVGPKWEGQIVPAIREWIAAG
jgi:hypothetical protein